MLDFLIVNINVWTIMKSDWWRNFLKLDDNIEIRRKTFVLYCFSYFGSLVIIVFAIRHWGQSNLLNLTLFGGVFVILANILYFNYSRQITPSCAVASITTSCFVVLLVYSGGYEGTALFWAFPFPPVILVLLGPRWGMLLNLLLFASLIYLLFLADFGYALYTQAEKSRFLASFATLMMLSFIAELFRVKSHIELTEQNFEKQKLAHTDQLTKLPNRRFLENVYKERLLKNPLEHFPVTIVVADIDHFKKVNDTYGHDVGDNVLLHVATTLRRGIRQTDVLIRIGGEEFIIFYPNTQHAVCQKLVEHLRQRIESSSFLDGEISLDTTMSFGVATALTETDLDHAIKEADSLLYSAKLAGRNRVM